MNIKLKRIRSEFINQKTKSYFYELASKYLASKKLVLDVGCGLGNFIKLQPHNTIGIDKSKDNINNLLKTIPEAKVELGDTLNLRFKDKYFDGVHCSHLIEHFAPIDAYQLLFEINRVLKVGGIMVISSPLMWDGFYDDLTHIRPYSHTSIIHYFSNMSHSRTFKNINCEYKVVDIKYRYYAKKIEPIVVTNRFISILFIFIAKTFNFLGLRKWKKNGYTVILEKIS